jgi:hypothetical protein
MISKDELNLLFGLNVVRVCSARWVLFLSFFVAAFIGQTIGWLVVRSAKKRSVHTLQKTVRNQIIQIFSFSQMTFLEVVSKPQIRFKGKAQADRKSAAYMGM